MISLDLNYEEIRNCLKKEPRIIRLPEKGKAVFVGDTHGDVETTEEVLNRYFKPGYTFVFLGDYVDRGRSSRGHIPPPGQEAASPGQASPSHGKPRRILFSGIFPGRFLGRPLRG